MVARNGGWQCGVPKRCEGLPEQSLDSRGFLLFIQTISLPMYFDYSKSLDPLSGYYLVAYVWIVDPSCDNKRRHGFGDPYCISTRCAPDGNTNWLSARFQCTVFLADHHRCQIKSY